ncbi:MAG: ribokinase [Actinomycetota bacterium]
MSRTLAVVGAINVDLVVRALKLPAPGETVGGGEFARHHGGKGGNQAVGAARALRGTHAVVVMIGAVGDDDLGRDATSALETEGVALQVRALDEPTGVALITVDADGENQIAVAPGANVAFGGQPVDDALREHHPDVVLVSLEVAPDAALAAARYCAGAGSTLVLNPAPPSLRTRELLPMAAYVTPNETEHAAMGHVPDGMVVVETRGAEGVRILHDDDPPVIVPAPTVEVVDTTGAGDCFNGVFAAALLEGLGVEDAARRAVVAASLSVTTPGAREGMPTREEIDDALGEDVSLQ